ncbi:MAG: HAD-IIIA family hydrolase, partial [Microthrixaceae bacterium]
RPGYCVLFRKARKERFWKRLISSNVEKRKAPLWLSLCGLHQGYGDSERYKKVQTHYEENRIRDNRSDGAIFLDRDGTINQRSGYAFRPELLKLIPGSAGAIRAFNQSGLRTVLVTNQPVIARGECTPKGLQDIHNYLETLLGAEGAWLDQLYFCPHHPDKGLRVKLHKASRINAKCQNHILTL